MKESGNSESVTMKAATELLETLENPVVKEDHPSDLTLQDNLVNKIKVIWYNISFQGNRQRRLR